MAGGRPSKYSDELAKEICERIADGESLRSICREEGMPNRDTIYSWLQNNDNKTFSDQYARAKDQQAESLFEEIDEISRRPMKNMVEVNRARLQIDALKWRAGKLAPKKYGDKVDLTSSDGTMSPDRNLTVKFVKAKSVDIEG